MGIRPEEKEGPFTLCYHDHTMHQCGGSGGDADRADARDKRAAQGCKWACKSGSAPGVLP